MRLFKVFPITPSAAAPDLDGRRFCQCCLTAAAVSYFGASSSILQQEILPPVRACCSRICCRLFEKNIMLTIVKAQMLNRPYIHYIDVKIMNASVG
jgi:hypothetical protein